MLPIGHPNYVYRPRSAEVRAKLSASQLARLGIPIGYSRLWGTILPRKVAQIARPMLAAISQELGRISAEHTAASLLGKSLNSVRSMVANFYRQRAEASATRREMRAQQTKQKRRDYQRKRHQTKMALRPGISEAEMEDAMLMFDEGASVNQISEALRLPRTKILARIRETKRMS